MRQIRRSIRRWLNGWVRIGKPHMKNGKAMMGVSVNWRHPVAWIVTARYAWRYGCVTLSVCGHPLLHIGGGCR